MFRDNPTDRCCTMHSDPAAGCQHVKPYHEIHVPTKDRPFTRLTLSLSNTPHPSLCPRLPKTHLDLPLVRVSLS